MQNQRNPWDAATRSASSLYFIAAETPLFFTSMNAPWIFLFVAACVELITTVSHERLRNAGGQRP